jgi:hypothetical protein
MHLIESLRQYLRAHEMQAGGDGLLAWENAEQELKEAFVRYNHDPAAPATKKVNPAPFSIRAIAEATIPQWEHVKQGSVKRIYEAMVSSAFPNITGALIHSRLIDGYAYEVGAINELITEDTAIDYPDSRVVGYGAGEDLDLVPEGKLYTDTILTEKNILVRQAKFGKMIELTREMVLYDKTNQVVSRARAIGEKMGAHRAKMIIQTIEMLPRTKLGESTSTLRNFVYDGTAITKAQFYATTHATVIDKQVNSNTHTTALSTAGMNEAYTLLAGMVDEDGENITVRPTHVLVHPNNEASLDQLLHSQYQYDTADRALNPYGTGGIRAGLRPVSSVYIATNTNWYLGRFPTQVLWHWGWRPETLAQGSGSDAAFERDVVNRFRVGYMGGCAHQDYRYIIYGNV